MADDLENFFSIRDKIHQVISVILRGKRAFQVKTNIIIDIMLL